MPDFDNLAEQAEDKIASTLDKHAAAARVIAWVLVVLNGVYGVVVALNGAFLGGALGVVTACFIVWLLVKTRAPKALA